MNARATHVRAMTDESRIGKLESNVQHLQADVTEIKGEVRSLRDAFESFKTEVAKEFGSVRTAIERAKLWMVVTGAGMILSVWGAAVALARFLKP